MKFAQVLLCSLLLTAVAGLAADPKPTEPPTGEMKPITKEQRTKMAAAHEKMAACLKSEAPVEECHQQMMKSCEDEHGKGKCGHMGGMMGHGGKMKHHEKHEKGEKEEKEDDN